MTPRRPDIERMLRLGLGGMAEALREQEDIPDIASPAFDDRLALPLEREVEVRDNRSCPAHLRRARLRVRSCIEDVDCRAGRGISRTLPTRIAAGGRIRQGVNMTVTGACGCGRAWLACAVARQACRRMPELVIELAGARDSHRLDRLTNRLARPDLVVLEDRGFQELSPHARRCLLEIVERRCMRKSAMIVSRLPAGLRHQAIGEPTLADAILDRIVRNARHIELKGESMRRLDTPQPLADDEDHGGRTARTGIRTGLRKCAQAPCACTPVPQAPHQQGQPG